MAWIKVDPIEVKKHPKFHAFKKKLGWESHQAFGFLGALWGEVANTEANESGDISDWTPDYLADRIGVRHDPDSLWEALVPGYIEVRPNERFFVRDWLELAGDFLREKWRGRKGGHEHLTQIWANYGRIYGRKLSSESDPTEDSPGRPDTPTDDQQKTHSDFTVGEKDAKNRTIPTPEKFPPGYPVLPPREDLKASIPFGSEESPPDKPVAAVSILQREFLAGLKARLEEDGEAPVDFNYGKAGSVFKKILDCGYGVQDIVSRFGSWFKSTDPHIVKHSYSVTLLPRYFNTLKDGPISNQGPSNGIKTYQDGYATAGREHEIPC